MESRVETRTDASGTAVGMEISSAPPTKRRPDWSPIKKLHRQLHTSQAMYEEVVEENQRLLREKARLEQNQGHLSKMLESLKSKEAENSSINASRQGNEEDCTALQAQLKLTCQEIISLRRSSGAKDVEIAALKRDVFLAREANDSANKAMKQDLEQLRVRSREQGEELRVARAKCVSLEGQVKEARAETGRERESGREWEERCERGQRDLLDARAEAENAREGWERAKEALRVAAEEAEGLREVEEGEREGAIGLRKVCDQLADDLLDAQSQLEREGERGDRAEVALSSAREEWEEAKNALNTTIDEQKRELVRLRTETAKAVQKAGEKFAAAEEARDAMAGEKEKMMAALERARDHISTLDQDKGALEREIQILNKIAEENQARLDEAMRVTDAKFLDMSTRAGQAIQEVLERAKAMHESAETKRLATEAKIAKRDAEIDWLRGVWSTMLVAHPDRELVNDAAHDEISSLRKDLHLVTLEKDKAVAECEEMVSAIASLHLRLVVCNWRRSVYREGLRNDMSRIKHEVEVEDMTMEGGGMLEGDNSIAEIMLRSINLEREQRERNAFPIVGSPNVSPIVMARGQTVGQQQTILQMVQRRHYKQTGGISLSGGEVAVGGGVSIEEALLRGGRGRGRGDMGEEDEGQWWQEKEDEDGEDDDVREAQEGEGVWEINGVAPSLATARDERAHRQEAHQQQIGEEGDGVEESGGGWKKQALMAGRAKYGGLSGALSMKISAKDSMDEESGKGSGKGVVERRSGQFLGGSGGGGAKGDAGVGEFGLVEDDAVSSDGGGTPPPRYSDIGADGFEDEVSEHAWADLPRAAAAGQTDNRPRDGVHTDNRWMLDDKRHWLEATSRGDRRFDPVSPPEMLRKASKGGRTERERSLEEALKRLEAEDEAKASGAVSGNVSSVTSNGVRPHVVRHWEPAEGMVWAEGEEERWRRGRIRRAEDEIQRLEQLERQKEKGKGGKGGHTPSTSVNVAQLL